MFDIGVTVYGDGDMPAAIQQLGLPQWHAEQRNDGVWTVYVRSPTRQSCELFSNIISILRQSEARVCRVTFGLRNALDYDVLPKDNCFFDHSEVVAFRVASDFLVGRLNPAEDDLRSVPKPCLGVIRPDRPIFVDERPEGFVVSSGANKIFQKTMAEFLMREMTNARVGKPVIYREQELKNWCRIEVLPNINIIDPMFFEPVVCVACGSPILADTRIWFGKHDASLSVGFDQAGYDHFAIEHPLIVSPRVARAMDASFGRGYGLFPVLDTTGPTAVMVREVREHLRPFRARRREWTIDPAEKLGLKNYWEKP